MRIWLIAVAVACGLSGCETTSKSTGVNPLVPEPDPPHSQDSPEHSLRLLEWSYNQENIDAYRPLFTADFRFVFSDLDSNGSAYRDIPWTREDEIISANKLFNGGDADQPKATDIRLMLDRNFNVVPDERRGKDPGWHVMVTTQLVLHIQLADGHADDVTGSVKFYLTRADSAAIPPDLGASDPTAWYIDRWEDMTAQGDGGLSRARSSPLRLAGPTSVHSLHSSTWGGIKALYR